MHNARLRQPQHGNVNRRGGEKRSSSANLHLRGGNSMGGLRVGDGTVELEGVR